MLRVMLVIDPNRLVIPLHFYLLEHIFQLHFCTMMTLLQRFMNIHVFQRALKASLERNNLVKSIQVIITRAY